ncbi:MAG: hypothetical protein WCU88_12600 [Elusimicrobiota bacterium]|jgi:hypothetical protein
MRRLLLLALLSILAAPPSLFARTRKTPRTAKAGAAAVEEPERRFDNLDSPIEPDTDLIDVPTAGILDVGGFATQTRFFSEGGVMEWLNFGVVHRVNLGASMNVDRLIGTGSPIQLTRPDLQLKFRFYDGDHAIPAFAMGFDGQGYLYNRQEKRYNQRQRGVYLVGSQEIVWPGLQGHAGINISDFDSNALFGFLGASLNIQDKVVFMAEWDNLNNYIDSRLNLGMKVYVTPNAHIGFSARGVGQGGNFSNGVSRGPERVFQFKYSGNF